MDALTQTSNNEKSKYVRVYNLEGQKINKGRVVYTNDSILGLKKGKQFHDIRILDIGYIKTKHSGGNNILVACLAGMSFGAIAGASTADDLFWVSPSEGATAFGLLGAIGGAAIGGIVSGAKNRETFIIDGDINKWLIFKEFID